MGVGLERSGRREHPCAVGYRARVRDVAGRGASEVGDVAGKWVGEKIERAVGERCVRDEIEQIEGDRVPRPPIGRGDRLSEAARTDCGAAEAGCLAGDDTGLGRRAGTGKQCSTRGIV